MSSAGNFGLADGGTLLEERRFDPVAGVMEADHGFVDALGQRRSVTYRIRTYTATELVRLIAEAGFPESRCFGGLAGEELTTESRLVVLARRPE